MIKVDKVILRETAYIAVWVLIFSALLQSVFLMFGLWDPTVLFGNLYSGVAVVLNFFLMGFSIQKALAKDEKEVKNYMKATGTLRLLFLFLVAIVGALLPQIFNIWAVLVPLFFPRVAIAFRPYFKALDVEEHSVASADAEGTADAENTENSEEINDEGGVDGERNG